MADEQVLLMCDVVDSTALTERLGDVEAAHVWQLHDSRARALLAAWRGREVDKTDGLFALFDSVDDALGFAAGYHETLAGLHPPMQARAAIHRAHVLVRQTPADEVARGAKPLDVDGMAKPLVARICALALPGQTLASENAQRAVAAQAALRPLGHWRFKGAGEPLALFEPTMHPLGPPPDVEKAWRVSHDGRRWLPVREQAHSLPAERDGFVGRNRALADLAAAFAGGARFVNLLGIGGTGKTRLALHHGWDALGEHAGGVWFCDLAQAVSADGVVHAVAKGLQLSLGAGDPVQQIGRAIAGRGNTLVILDNFEQVARHADATLGEWLDQAPAARFLVTSREVLGLPGEAVMALPPLDVDDAVALFLRRAQAAQQGFSPDAAELDAVRRLTQRLDGLPLAIELAAARVRAMPPAALLQRMNQRFELLLSRGGRPDRQATLRAALDWSWDLLDADERALLAQLSVFQGGFDTTALESVVMLAAGRSAIDLLGALVDKSLVRPLTGGRFGLLETVREYASLRLRGQPGAQEDPAAAVDLRLRHARHFAQLGEQEAMAGRGAELDNLVGACRVAMESGDAPLASRCLVNCWIVLRRTGPFRAAVELAEQVAAMRTQTGEAAALAEWVWGTALGMLGEAESARDHLQRGRASASVRSTSEASARIAVSLGNLIMRSGDLDQARAEFDDALSQSVALQMPRLQADVLNALGGLMDHQTRLADARRLYEQGLALARELGDRQLEGGFLGNLGGLHHVLGELDAARRLYEQSLATAESAGDWRWLGNGCSNLGLLLLEQGELQAAHTQLGRALSLARSAGNVQLAYTADCNLGILLSAQGRLDEAERHLGAAVDAAARNNDRHAEGQFRGYWGVALARLGRLDEARAALTRGEQALAAMKDPLSNALLLCDRAEVESLSGQPQAARQTLAAATAVADELACGDESELRRRIAAVTALLGR
jgi:predicted ATPase/Tfp pilus assembly protein PilF